MRKYEEKQLLEKLRQDITISTNNLVATTIIREEYVIKLLEYLFDKLAIEKPDFNYDFGFSIKKSSNSTDFNRKGQ